MSNICLADSMLILVVMNQYDLPIAESTFNSNFWFCKGSAQSLQLVVAEPTMKTMVNSRSVGN